MIKGKRIHALARTSAAVLIATALGACGAGTHSAASTQTSDATAAQSNGAAPLPALPEIVVTATRLAPPRVAAETSSRIPAKRRG
jgi:hypothetical protein